LISLILTGLLCQMPLTDTDAVLLLEEVETVMPGSEADVYRRSSWIGRNAIRTDIGENKVSLIYNARLRTSYVLDHENAQYFLVMASRDKSLTRASFFGIAHLASGQLLRKSPMAIKTGRRMKISGFDCYEYQLNYPPQFGMSTTFWTTPQPTFLTTDMLRRFWFAAVGFSPAPDVRRVIDTLIEELNGIPIRVVTTINQENIEIVTTQTVVHIQRETNMDPAFFNTPTDYRIADGVHNIRPWSN